MRVALVALALTTLPVAPSPLAQDCPAGPANDIPELGDATLPFPPDYAFAAVQRVLKTLNYRIESADSTQGIIRTAVGHRKPNVPELQPFRKSDHPGIRVTVTISDAQGHSHLAWALQAVCASPDPPPPGYDLPVETAYEAGAVIEFEALLTDELAKWHRRNPAISGEATPPELISCPAAQLPPNLPAGLAAAPVLVRVTIDSTGALDPSSVYVSDHVHPDLANAVRNVVRRCRFRPGRLDARPMTMSVTVPIQLRSR